MAQKYVLVVLKTRNLIKKIAKKPDFIRVFAFFRIKTHKYFPKLLLRRNLAKFAYFNNFFRFHQKYYEKTKAIHSFCLSFSSFSLFSACSSNKTGCPVNESVHAKTDKKGNFSSKGGKSNLFPKNMRSGSKKKKN